jgi:TRAP-type C4-dicarboxylate transport system substrate-binding protein
MLKKKAFFSMLVFALILTLLAVLPLTAGAAEKNIKLRLSSVAAGPGQFPNSDSVKWWMDKVTEKTKGQVTFQSHWGASLAPPAGHIDLLEKGMVEVILGCRIYTPGKFPLGAFEYIFPFGPLDSHMVLQAKRQLYEEIPGFREELAKANALLISNFSTMPYDICSKTPIQKLDDFKGKRIGLIGRYFARWVKPTGAVPVVAPMHERYTLLQTKVTDMDFHPITHMNAFKVQEVAPNFVQINAMIGAPWDLMISLKAFNGLSPEIQKILIETGKEVEIHHTKNLLPRWQEKLWSEWKTQGVKFSSLPEAERAKWASLIEDIPAEWAAEVGAMGLPGWQIVQRFQEITAEKGYKWPRKWGVKKG